MICRPCPMYTRLAQEDSEESALPSNNRRSSASWGLLAIAIVVLLLLTFPRLPQAPNKVRPSPAFHYMPALPQDTDEATTSKNTEKAKIQADQNHQVITKTEVFTTSVTSSGAPLQCVPAEKVGFAKTHKTASSTVQNIFLRWGLNHGWNFALLTSGSHLGPPNNQYVLNQPFQASWLRGVPWEDMADAEGYQAVVLHTMWSQEEVEKVLGKEAIYITIVRDPVDQFESLYSYSHFETKLHVDIEEFVRRYVEPDREMPRMNGYLGRNQQLWDLGLMDTLHFDLVEAKVEEVDKNFHLVMIAEHFEESLVLLSHQLCWPLANMTSLKLNARKASQKSALSDIARQKLKSWLAADYHLYDHFTKKLEDKMLKFGKEKLAAEVAELQRLNLEVRERCVLEEVKDTGKLSENFRPWSKDVVGFRVSPEEDCQHFAKTEVHFIDEVRAHQMKRLREWWKSRGG